MRERLRSGPLLMIAGSVAFVAMTGFAKAARADLSGPEVVLWRGVISAPLLLLVFRGSVFRLRNSRVFALRLLLGFGAMTLFTIAVKGLALTDLSLIGKLRPIVIGAAAPLLFGRSERAGRGLWLSMVAGLAGCALIIGPHLAIGSLYGLWAFIGVLLSSGAHLALRALGDTDTSGAIVFGFHIGIAALSAVTLLLVDGQITLPPPEVWPVLAGVAVAATAGQLLMTRAYALATAPTVAAASYTGPLWALIADLLVFGLVPSLMALVGGAIVVGSSLWLVLATRLQARPGTD